MRYLLLLLAGFLLISCSSKPKDASAGISLSFDDRSIKEWYQLRSLFKEHEVSVTFFITQPDSLSPIEIEMLRTLEEDGHEIGFHGNMHVFSEYYIKEHSYQEYFKNEIDKGIFTMDSLGFKCTSFAYPYGSKYWFTDFLLLKKFRILRGVASVRKSDLTKSNAIYYSFDGDRTVSATSFDTNSDITLDMIKKALQRCKANEEVLMLYAHSPSEDKKSGYHFDRVLLENIITEAQRLDINFYRVKDLN